MRVITLFLEDYKRSRLLSLVSVAIPFLAFLIIYSLTNRPTFLMLFPIYLIVTLLIIYKPEIVIILIVLFTSTIFGLDAFPQPVSLGEIGFYLPEVLIVLLLVRTLVAALRQRDFKKMSSPLTMPMILLFIWIIFSVVNAILSQRATLLEGILVGRGYIFYANFFLILYYLDTKEKVNLVLKSLIIVAGICAICSVIQYLIGPDVKIFSLAAWSVVRLTYNPDELTLARVVPISISLIYIIFFPVLVIVINGNTNKNWWYKIFIVLAVLSFFVSFTRNVYYSIAIGLFLMWLNFKGRIRWRITRNVITTFLTVILIAYLPVFLGIIKVPNWWQQVFSRHNEFFTAGDKTETLICRAIETKAIMAEIVKSLILGNGIGATYYHPFYAANVAVAHNGFLSIIFQLGLIGLAIFVFVFYRYITYSIKIYNSIKGKYSQSLILGFLIGFAALLPAVWVKPVFANELFWISLMGLIWALPQVILRINNNGNDSQLSKSRA